MAQLFLNALVQTNVAIKLLFLLFLFPFLLFAEEVPSGNPAYSQLHKLIQLTNLNEHIEYLSVTKGMSKDEMGQVLAKILISQSYVDPDVPESRRALIFYNLRSELKGLRGLCRFLEKELNHYCIPQHVLNEYFDELQDYCEPKAARQVTRKELIPEIVEKPLIIEQREPASQVFVDQFKKKLFAVIEKQVQVEESIGTIDPDEGQTLESASNTPDLHTIKVCGELQASSEVISSEIAMSTATKFSPSGTLRLVDLQEAETPKSRFIIDHSYYAYKKDDYEKDTVSYGINSAGIVFSPNSYFSAYLDCDWLEKEYDAFYNKHNSVLAGGKFFLNPKTNGCFKYAIGGEARKFEKKETYFETFKKAYFAAAFQAKNWNNAEIVYNLDCIVQDEENLYRSGVGFEAQIADKPLVLAAEIYQKQNKKYWICNYALKYLIGNFVYSLNIERDYGFLRDRYGLDIEWVY